MCRDHLPLCDSIRVESEMAQNTRKRLRSLHQAETAERVVLATHPVPDAEAIRREMDAWESCARDPDDIFDHQGRASFVSVLASGSEATSPREVDRPGWRSSLFLFRHPV